MRFYEASARIDAPREVVWAALTEGAAYPSWDSGVTRVEGTIAEGERITVHAEISPGRTFPVKVHIDESADVMRWTGGMPLHLFRGVRTFTVEPGTDGTTGLTVREEYSGPLLGLIWRSMPDLAPSFEQYVTGLKAEAERRVALS